MVETVEWRPLKLEEARFYLWKLYHHGAFNCQAQFAFDELNELHGEPQRMLFISGVLLAGDQG